jgi:hypothetical protein
MLPYDCWAAVAGRDLMLEEFSGDVSAVISVVSKFYWSAVQVVWFVSVKINSLALTFLITRNMATRNIFTGPSLRSRLLWARRHWFEMSQLPLLR